MRSDQQPTAPPPQQPPQPPQAGAPPAPNAPVFPGGTMTEQQKADLRAQIQKSVREGLLGARDAGKIARDAGRIAQEAAAAARQGQGTTFPSLPPDPNDWSPGMIRGFVTDGLTGVCITIVVLVLGSKLLRILANRLGSAPAPSALSPQVAEQLKRIENTVDSMAIEIERISESQRFLTKLQAAKEEGAALPRASSGA